MKKIEMIYRNNFNQLIDFYRFVYSKIGDNIPIINQVYDFDGTTNNTIDYQGIEIINKCLQLLPNDRPTAAELLHMDWFTKDPDYNEYYNINKDGTKINKLIDIEISPIKEQYNSFNEKNQYIDYINENCVLTSSEEYITKRIEECNEIKYSENLLYIINDI
jgi:serine/threonine protein kinase